MKRNSPISRRLRAGIAVAASALTAGALAGALVGTAVSTSAAAARRPRGEATIKVAYLSFAVQNSYDAPMLAAARAEARRDHVALTVFDANNSTTTQFSQFQDAISSKEYKGIIVQPIFGPGLVTLARQAIADHIEVADMDQILGSNLDTDQPQVKGLAVNVVFVPEQIGVKLGQLVAEACAKLSPCNVGYMYDIKASSLDEAVYRGFRIGSAGHKNVKVVASGQSFFTPSDGLSATQDMLQAQPGLSLIVGSDQGIEGAQQALAEAGKTGKVILVGYGASAAALRGVRSGAWFGDVAQRPATEGRLAVEDLASAIRTGVLTGGVDPVSELPDGGVITKANVGLFHAEWPG